MKKVSVIMATYKTPKEFLEKSIESILKQTYKNIEFIIIIDGDEENLEVVNKFEDSRIKIINNQTNYGLAYSLNKGIENATGEYIARMDADDISINTRIEKQVNFLNKNHNIDVVGTYAYKFGDKKGISMFPYYDADSIKIQLLFRSILIHPTVMIRKSFLIKNKLKYNENFKVAQDYELWSRIIKIGNIAVIPFIGLKLRIHQSQLSASKKSMQDENAKKIIINNIKYYFNIKQPTQERIETFLILGRKKELNINNNNIVLKQMKEMMKEKNDMIFRKQLKLLYFISFISSKNIKLLNVENISIIFSLDIISYLIKKVYISIKCKKEMVSEKNELH